MASEPRRASRGDNAGVTVTITTTRSARAGLGLSARTAGQTSLLPLCLCQTNGGTTTHPALHKFNPSIERFFTCSTFGHQQPP